MPEFGSFLLSWSPLVVFCAQSDQPYDAGEYYYSIYSTLLYYFTTRTTTTTTTSRLLLLPHSAFGTAALVLAVLAVAAAALAVAAAPNHFLSCWMLWTLPLKSQSTHTAPSKADLHLSSHPCSTVCHACESARIALIMPFELVATHCSSLMRRTFIPDPLL